MVLHFHRYLVFITKHSSRFRITSDRISNDVDCNRFIRLICERNLTDLDHCCYPRKIDPAEESSHPWQTHLLNASKQARWRSANQCILFLVLNAAPRSALRSPRYLLIESDYARLLNKTYRPLTDTNCNRLLALSCVVHGELKTLILLTGNENPV